MNDFTVEAIGLTRLYGGREAVSNVSFNLSKGQVLGFLGPNGAGKSTTMKMLTGNLAPSNGSVKICGIDMIENPKEAKALIGYLPEMRPLYKELTVDEYLTIAARLHRVSGAHIKKAVELAKERCGLSHMSKRLIENLSNGYQQRVGIAQAIIHNPMVVILDEPTVGLDPIQIRDIRALIREVGSERSVIISTHILPEVEMVCDPPKVAELLKIAGVEEAEGVSDQLMRVRFADGATPAEAIVQAAVAKGWGLYQIGPDQTSLEDVFVQLTYQEQEAA
jgi:ABC-2 type transport system ATP-binding protein